jgi:superfamily II DNA or RNA helicase/HKD family nuclease/diadenosine tetraphosphate (Ap4A) HIT family hydrolase
LSLGCPFCSPDPGRVFLRLEHVFALWDGFPVSDGHALIVPHRHIATWFEATAEERAALFGAIETVCGVIRAHWHADGFNVGVNLGEAAGQTVPHLHLHVIPRRHGDVPDPRGGVRHVIPGKGFYPSGLPPAELGPGNAGAVADWAHPSEPGAARYSAAAPVLTTGGANPLLPHLERDLASASAIDIAVAFVLPSGVERLYPHFEDLLARGGTLRLLTGDYLDISDPEALQRLIDLRSLYSDARCDLRIFCSDGNSFHPKAYLASQARGGGVAYVGSSNLSRSALLEGVEWNYRVASARDAEGWHRVHAAFEQLFRHPSTEPLDDDWLNRYRARRAREVKPHFPETDQQPEPPLPVPEPNLVQSEALAALEETRAAGNGAGLVVMATGLGKTWLAAFDTAREAFRRILFVAHREEILSQAVATFRRIRPTAAIGLYHGGEKSPKADILFASVQTLSRRAHLGRFAPDAFDYIVVDEFHHAAAATYQRLIDHFRPAFLLGLTATPERTDGGDLLALCGENLVYRCAVPRGIELGLLCPFDYYGVPDDVDYTNIPWRSSRFDEEELTAAVATQKRAANILDQWRKRGGERTIAFCVSQRHADFMRDWFARHGVPCAAVHSGPGSDQRSLSLEQLAAGELAVVFAVDMFNEGVDVPAIDTVMMLRPTESPVVWLQQFGRGLRRHGEKRLAVVDYIGNHRSFLLKARTLLDVQEAGDHALRAALERLESGQHELPPGCSVTYELEAMSILRALLRVPPAGAVDALREYYEDFRARHGQRPTAAEAFHDGYLPKSARPRHGSWLGLVRAMGDLDPAQEAVLESASAFLAGLEVTKMVRSFKMLVLQAMLNTDTLPGPGIGIEALAAEFARLAGRSTKLRADVAIPLEDLAGIRRLLITDPIAAWAGPGAIPGHVLFTFVNGVFRCLQPIPDGHRSALQQLVRELVDWRLAQYLFRSATPDDGNGSFVMKVSHSAGKPILFLPDRDQRPDIPKGWQTVLVDGKPHQANFVNVAVNVVREPGADVNVLAPILRGWFGADAGLPGTDYHVACEFGEEGWILTPMGRRELDRPELFRKYSREQIPRLFDEEFSSATWNAGFVPVPARSPRHICLLVTLHKGGMAQQFQYGDRFLAPDLFQWQSQNRTRQDSAHGHLIQDHAARGVTVHLFVRAEKKRGATSAPFVYCGPVTFVDWEGDAPITVRWRLGAALPERLSREFMSPAI